MNRAAAHWQQRVAVFAAALWWGSLTGIGFIAVPMLFARLATPVQAGNTAAILFTAQTWISVASGMLLLFAARSRDRQALPDLARGTLGFVLAGILLALLAEFAVAPHIVLRDNLRLWHSVGSAMYLVQWMCAATALWKTAFRSAGPS